MLIKPVERAPCEPGSPLRLGVLHSRTMGHLQFLLEACAQVNAPATLEVVLSEEKESKGLERARASGVVTRTLRADAFESESAFAEAMLDTLDTRDVELLCLSDYHVPLLPLLADRFAHRVLWAQPWLWTDLPGSDPIQHALTSGLRITGCSICLAGSPPSIILQSALRIAQHDDVESLGVRMQHLEQRALLEGIRLIATGRVELDEQRVVITGVDDREGSLEWLVPPGTG